jgi:flagellum-specific peptidoglycan hydrolase FlgJ
MTKGGWKGETVTTSNGWKWRAYGSLEESVEDHNKKLGTDDRYNNIPHNTDYKQVAKYLEQDGYCKDKGYADTLIKMIKSNGWDKYDPKN